MSAVKCEGAAGGVDVTEIGGTGTSGGWSGMNGAARRLALQLLAGFALILALVAVANAESMITEFAADRVPVASWHVWLWELTSIFAWITVLPMIWWAVQRVRPPRFGWGQVALIGAAGLPLAYAWHVGLMIVLRVIVYRAVGERYQFEGGLPHPWLYEFRKDIVPYLQFVSLAVLSQWLLARAGAPAPAIGQPVEAAPRFLEVPDGAVTHRVPFDEIDTVTAAGNYVELGWRDRTLLHRATLAAVEAELGDGFTRIHRSRVVRRAAIRSVETNQAGDFEVVLANGARVKGSRRYRAGVER